MEIVEQKLLSPNEVMEKIEEAYIKKQKLSVVRLGDGEALTLAQSIVMPFSEIQKREFLPYAGLQVPNLKARDELLEAIKKADIVGVAMNELEDFTPLLNKCFHAHKIDVEEMTLTNACINYFLLENDMLKNFLLKNPNIRVLLVGNATPYLLPIFNRVNIKVAGLIKPVKGVKDWQRVTQLAGKYRFDIALVSAGIAAVMICEEIAKKTNKIAIDFGHATNLIGIRKYL